MNSVSAKYMRTTAAAPQIRFMNGWYRKIELDLFLSGADTRINPFVHESAK